MALPIDYLFIDLFERLLLPTFMS